MLYWLGQVLIVVPVAARMLSRRHLGVGETVTLVVILTVAEYLVKVCYSPAGFTFGDELAHWRSTVDILQTGKLFQVNDLLPISPHYPGLEEVTAALVSITGLSVFASGLIVAGVAHLLFVLVLYVLFRQDQRLAPGRWRRHPLLCQQLAVPVVRLDVRLPDARSWRSSGSQCWLPSRLPRRRRPATAAAGSRSPCWPPSPPW